MIGGTAANPIAQPTITVGLNWEYVNPPWGFNNGASNVINTPVAGVVSTSYSFHFTLKKIDNVVGVSTNNVQIVGVAANLPSNQTSGDLIVTVYDGNFK